ncbi:MAG: excinuclease ABC subunit UvrC [Myxococcales bacterium]
MLDEAIQHKLDRLPASPGVYVFRDRAGAPLYVGKASNLKNRVRSYFQAGSSDTRFFIDRLQHELGDVETFVAKSEKEAALLENGLIKEHQPRYNVKLRDDKEFLSLRLDESARWPRLEVVRRPKKDGAHYFGPYHSASAARSTLRLVNRHFRLRTCTDSEMRSRARPCLQHQIRRCPGPCVLEVDRDEYAEQVRNVALFLEGRHDELGDRLQRAMHDAAEGLRYELAATYRDQLRAVESTRQQQRVSLVTDVDQDVFGYFRQDDKAELAVLLARRGRVVGVRTFDLKQVTLPDDELVASFVGEYYRHGSFVPHEVLLPVPIEAAEGLEDLLSEQRGARVKVLRPQRGNKAQLLRMAMENAAHAYREKARAREDLEARLSRVQKRLGLPHPPRRFECIDVSHIGGQHTVAAIVAFADGAPDRKRYRNFHVKNVSGGDDYGAMREVLLRRFRRGKSGEARWQLPDLLVVDGGKGQLNIALAALDEIGVTDLPLAALAKEKETGRGERVVDRVYLPGRMNAIELREGGGDLMMLAHARDEAHRASNLLRDKVGRKRRLQSGLDAVPGVGPRTRATLLKALGSTRAIEQADAETLVDAGATRRQAQAIVAHFGADDVTDDSEQQAVENAFSR